MTGQSLHVSMLVLMGVDPRYYALWCCRVSFTGVTMDGLACLGDSHFSHPAYVLYIYTAFEISTRITCRYDIGCLWLGPSCCFHELAITSTQWYCTCCACQFGQVPRDPETRQLCSASKQALQTKGRFQSMQRTSATLSQRDLQCKSQVKCRMLSLVFDG